MLSNTRCCQNLYIVSAKNDWRIKETIHLQQRHWAEIFYLCINYVHKLPCHFIKNIQWKIINIIEIYFWFLVCYSYDMYLSFLYDIILHSILVYVYQNLWLQVLTYELVFHGPCTFISHHASVDTFSQLCNVVTLKSV